MKVGTLCYACDSGLGILAKSFYDHGIITDPFVVRHAHHLTHTSWYPYAPQTPIRGLDRARVLEHLGGCDLALFFETPFDWTLLHDLRQRGVKTVLMTMYECTPWGINPDNVPDLFLCPSLLDYRYFNREGFNSTFCPVPVDREWKLREKATRFIHNAGHCGLRGRNGTRELYAALQHVKKPLDITIRYQERCCDELPGHATTVQVGNVTVHCQPGTVSSSDLYAHGDVFVFPEKFNGLSLPLQEAYASGLAIIATDRFPMNTWLPTEPLIPSCCTRSARVGSSYLEFDEAIVEPLDIAERLDELNGTDITGLSLQGKDWAEEHSWDVLRPRYNWILENVLNGKASL